MKRAWLIALVALVACNRRDRCARVKPGAVRECRAPGYRDRVFEIHAPARWDGKTSVPVVLLLHGGGGSRAISNGTTCPGGDKRHPGCFVAAASARGFAVVIPDGTKPRIGNMRTWNAGGGGASPHGELDCVSGPACAQNVDDIAYFTAVLDTVGRAIPIDPKRVYATGLSNGGAMSHRLACELPERMAAIVSVGGGNQHAAAGGKCAGGVAVLEIHGTRDVCWPYDGGGGDCFATKYKVGVDEMMAAWAQRNGCGTETIDEPIRDAVDDGVVSTRRTWIGCPSIQRIRMEGAGHTWPSGNPYSARAGTVTHDFDSDLILDFLGSNPRP